MKLKIKTWRFKNFIFKQIIISNICKISIYYFIDFSKFNSKIWKIYNYLGKLHILQLDTLFHYLPFHYLFFHFFFFSPHYLFSPSYLEDR